MQPGMSVSYVARRAGVAPSLLFNWRRRLLEGGLQAVQADEDVVGTTDLRAEASPPALQPVARPRSSDRQVPCSTPSMSACSLYVVDGVGGYLARVTRSQLHACIAGVR
jgi:transposase-like protein